MLPFVLSILFSESVCCLKLKTIIKCTQTFPAKTCFQFCFSFVGNSVTVRMENNGCGDAFGLYRYRKVRTGSAQIYSILGVIRLLWNDDTTRSQVLIRMVQGIDYFPCIFNLKKFKFATMVISFPDKSRRKKNCLFCIEKYSFFFSSQYNSVFNFLAFV